MSGHVGVDVMCEGLFPPADTHQEISVMEEALNQ